MKQVKLDSSVNLDCLKKSKFFQDINSVYLESIASSCINISTEKGEVLFKAGENNLAGIFYLISGKVILSSTEDDTDVERTNEVLKDETFNSLSIFYEMTRMETASALEPSNLLFVPKQALIDSCEKNSAFNTILHGKIAAQKSRLVFNYGQSQYFSRFVRMRKNYRRVIAEPPARPTEARSVTPAPRNS